MVSPFPSLLDYPVQERTFCFEPALYHELQVICQDNNTIDPLDDHSDTMRQGIHMAQEESVIWERKRRLLFDHISRKGY